MQGAARAKLADQLAAVTPTLDAGLHQLLETIDPATDASARASAADTAIAALLDERPLDGVLELATFPELLSHF